jgi:hypothetical protein
MYNLNFKTSSGASIGVAANLLRMARSWRYATHFTSKYIKFNEKCTGLKRIGVDLLLFPISVLLIKSRKLLNKFVITIFNLKFTLSPATKINYGNRDMKWSTIDTRPQEVGVATM